MARQVYLWCELQKKWVPAEDAMQIDRSPLANVRHGYIPDEMPPTKHPVTGEYFTSKAKFRKTTRALGMVEVGDAYDRGYDPSKRMKDDLREHTKKFKAELIQRYKGS